MSGRIHVRLIGPCDRRSFALTPNPSPLQPDPADGRNSRSPGTPPRRQPINGLANPGGSSQSSLSAAQQVSNRLLKEHACDSLFACPHPANHRQLRLGNTVRLPQAHLPSPGKNSHAKNCSCFCQSGHAYRLKFCSCHFCIFLATVPYPHPLAATHLLLRLEQPPW